MKPKWSFLALRWSYAIFIAYASVQTFVQAHGDEHHGWFVPALAAVEFLAATALFIEPLVAFAAVLLVVVYGVAAVLTISEGELPLRFVFYTATAVFIAQTLTRSRDLTA